jgi:hypothetical protein
MAPSSPGCSADCEFAVCEMRIKAQRPEPLWTPASDFHLMVDRKIDDLRRSLERTLWQVIIAIILAQMFLVALMAAVMLGIAEASGHC